MARFFKTVTGTHATLTSVIVPGSSGDQIILTAYNLTSDKAGSILDMQVNDGQQAVVIAADTTGANGNGQTVITVASATGFVQADVLVAQLADGTVEKLIIDTGGVDTTGVHELTCTTNLVNDLAVGDKIYRVITAGSIAVGAATVTGVAGGVYGYMAGPKGCPVLLELDSTSAGTVNHATVAFV